MYVSGQFPPSFTSSQPHNVPGSNPPPGPAPEQIEMVYFSWGHRDMEGIIDIRREVIAHKIDKWAQSDHLPEQEKKVNKIAAEKIKKIYGRSYDLDLEGIGLPSIPKEIRYLRHFLKHLNLNNNKLQFIPDEIGSLDLLEVLKLDDNQLQFVPATIGLLNNLKLLSLSNNQLQSLPDTLGSFGNLKYLYLNNNRLQSLPDSFSSLGLLEDLYLDHNQFQSLPAVVCTLKSLRNLYLTNNNLVSLPDTIGSLEYLLRLFLDNNNLQSLPDSIGSLEYLYYLRLNNNQLRSLPDSISSLKLTYLYLANNQLQYLPANMGSGRLWLFSVENNSELTSLPMTVGNYEWTFHLFCGNTRVPLNQSQALRTRSEAKRELGDKHLLSETRRESVYKLSLSDQWATWKAYANVWIDIWFPSLDRFPWLQRDKISNWLINLERCKDFELCWAELARVVYDIVRTLGNSQNFQHNFFSHLDSFFEHEPEPTWLLFYLIYTDWRLHTLPNSASTAEKFQLLVGVSKTMFLYEATRNNEEFSHYETILKDRLGLVIAFQQPPYPGTEAPADINIEDLVAKVNSGYINVLINLRPFMDLLKEIYGAEYTSKKEAITTKIKADSELINKTQYPTEEARKEALNAHKIYKETALSQLRKEYAQKLSIGK